MQPKTLNGIVYILLVILIIIIYRIIIKHYKEVGQSWKDFKAIHKFDTTTANIVFWVCAIAIVAFTILGLIL